LKGNWAKYAMERYEMLKKWEDYVNYLVRACREILGDCKIYVVGGAAENRLTVLSDLDILVVVEEFEPDWITKLNIRKRAEELGLPEDLPLDLKILNKKKFNEFKRLYGKIIEIN